MPTNTRTQSDVTWVDGYEPTAADWADLERKIFGSWNGDKGGAYCGPSATPWSFGGSGLKVTGTTRLSYGGSIKGGTSAFVIGNGAWPELGATHPARTRSIVCPINSWTYGNPGRSFSSALMTRSYLWSSYHPYAGVGSVALACKLANTSIVETCDLYIPLRVIDGAILRSVTIYYRVAQRRLLAPIAMPKFRIMRIPKNVADPALRTVAEPLKSTTDGRGYDSPTLLTSPDDWYNGGDVQSFTYVCDQNNEIDVSEFNYVVHLVEEQGVISVDDAFDGIRYIERKRNVSYVGNNTLTLNANQTVDTATGVGGGERVLIVDIDDDLASGTTSNAALSSLNGIWDGNSSGAWTRASDLDAQDDFTPFWIVTAIGESGGSNFGGVNNLTTWQCTSPTSSQKVDLATSANENKTQPWIQPAVPRGNIYHALVPTFELTDLRFQ